MLVEIVEDDLGTRVALEIDDDAGVLVRLIAHGADLGQDLLIHQLGDALDQGRAVHVVGNLGDDDLIAIARQRLNASATASPDAAASRSHVIADARVAADGTTRGEIRAFDVRRDLINGDGRILNLCAKRIDHLTQVVRRNVRGHADCDAGASIDQ